MYSQYCGISKEKSASSYYVRGPFGVAFVIVPQRYRTVKAGSQFIRATEMRLTIKPSIAVKLEIWCFQTHRLKGAVRLFSPSINVLIVGLFYETTKERHSVRAASRFSLKLVLLPQRLFTKNKRAYPAPRSGRLSWFFVRPYPTFIVPT